jgi:hypothetical protein
MFVTVAGIDATDAGGAHRIDELFRVLQDAIYAADGSINQFLVDDKGTTLVAAWGVPGRSHDNDAARAALAAIDIADRLAARGEHAGVGLATGRVFCGWRGNAARREFALVGRTVNLASRLSGRAHPVLADAVTRDASAARVRWADAGSIAVKGLVDPVVTFAPMPVAHDDARAPVATAPASIVGRAAERETLRRAIAEVGSGRGGTIFVEGEAGTGKSTLFGAATGEPDDGRVRVVAAAASPLVRTGALDVWRDLLEQILDLPERSRPEARIARLDAAFAAMPALRDSAPLIGSVLGLAVPDNDFTSGLTGTLRGEATREALVTLVQREAHRHPLLLVIDDAQWLDSLSWSALAALVVREPRLLVFVGHRPMPKPPPEWPLFERTRHVQFLRLDRLSDIEVGALVRRELDVATLPAALLAVIVRKTAGHPLFVIELVRWLRARGAIAVERGACRLVADVDTLAAELPATVEGVLIGRIDQLPAAPHLTLRVASVLGQTFSVDALTAIHPVDRDRASLARQLDACEQQRFLTRGAEPECGYAFSHALVHDVAYGLIVPTQRVAWHGAAATWLEAGQDASDAVLAYHWTQAEAYPRAVEYLDRAGSASAERGAGREPLTFFRRALALTDRHGVPVPALRRARWQRMISQACTRTGDARGAGAALTQAFQLLDHPFDETPRALRRRLAREIVRQATHVVRPPRGARTDGDAAERAREIVRAFRAATDRAYFAADHLAIATWAFAMVNVAESAGHPEDAAHGYASTAYMAALVGLRPLADRWWRVGGATADAEQHLAVLLSRALFHLGECQWAPLAEVLDAHEALARRASYTQLDNNLALRIMMEFEQGRLTRAESLAHALLDSAVAQRNDQHEMWARQAIEAFLIIRGRADEAEVERARLAELLPSISDTLTTVQQRAHTIAMALESGRIDDAIALRPELADWVHTKPPTSVGTLLPFQVLARVSMASWARATRRGDAGARRLGTQARADLRPLGRFARTFRYGRAYYALMRGGWHWLAGHPRRATRAWTQARRQAAATGQAVAEAEAERLLAMATRRDAATSTGHVARAEALEARIGFGRRFVDLDRWTAPSGPAEER